MSLTNRPDFTASQLNTLTPEKDTKFMWVLKREVELHEKGMIYTWQYILLSEHIVCFILFPDVILLKNLHWKTNFKWYQCS